MATKWADKLIDSVSYNREHTHIDMIQSRDDLGESVGSTTQKISRREVISKIKAGTSFATVFANGGKWKKGAPVEIVVINGQEFLKTVPDSTTRDNLGSLPEF